MIKKDEWLGKMKSLGERKDRLLIAFLFGVLLLVIAIPAERGRKGAEPEEGMGGGEDSRIGGGRLQSRNTQPAWRGSWKKSCRR